MYLTNTQAQKFIEAVSANVDIEEKKNKAFNIRMTGVDMSDSHYAPEHGSKQVDEKWNKLLQATGAEPDSYHGQTLLQQAKADIRKRKPSFTVMFEPVTVNGEHQFDVRMRVEVADDICDFIDNSCIMPDVYVNEYLLWLADNGSVEYSWYPNAI